MKNHLLVPICASLLVPLVSPVQAQRPPRGAPLRQVQPRFGDEDGRRPPRPRPSATRRLQRLWHDLDHLQEAGQPISKAQAGKIVALVRPWTTKPTLGETNAQKLHDQIEAVLTTAQREEVGGPPRFGPPGFGPQGRGPGDDGPGGGRRRRRPDFEPGGAGFGPPTEAQRTTGRAFIEALNPFYPPTGYSSWQKLPAPLQQDVARHYRENRATLEALSRQAKG
ncbi:MAG TPA: hypothetical protein VF627_06525 [Abditibacterium sp.]